jgi:gamma-glutamyltranspeptidase / glutathione hydrolase
MKRIILLLLVVTLVTCTSKQQNQGGNGVIADSAMVVSAHPLATQAGLLMLKKGGNAVDACVATQFALAVVLPAAGNLGGGGFMVYRANTGRVSTLDYREAAPSLAVTNMFLDSLGNVVENLSTKSHLASGVPGSVAGMAEAHEKYGRLPWHDVIQPAIDLALNGFALTEREARGLNSIQDDLKKNNTILPQFLIKDRWLAGDSIYAIDLGHTLERIRDQGASGFYEGKTADDVVAEMQRGAGYITKEDLRNYKPIWREALTGSYRNFNVICMPPPSSGGIALLQLLKSVEPYSISESGHNTAETIHLFTEAQRRVYADRAAHLGDPAFYQVPVKELLDIQYIESRMKTFDPARATPSSAIKEGDIRPHESIQTTHLSIVDKEGNAVAVTTTLNDSYGSRIVVAGSGFLLNNEMDDFSIKPGYANIYGAIGGEANKIEPGKRMLSSMTPTILEKDGKLFMVVGTPGGTTIITSVFQTVINVIDHKMGMQEAVSAKRLHSQWYPDEIFVEEHALDEATKKTLIEKGHKINPEFVELGRVDAILIRKDRKLEGGADPRGDDTALGL